MPNPTPTSVQYAAICKKATEMEKVIQDLQCKTKILFEQRDKESNESTKKRKTKGRSNGALSTKKPTDAGDKAKTIDGTMDKINSTINKTKSTINKTNSTLNKIKSTIDKTNSTINRANRNRTSSRGRPNTGRPNSSKPQQNARGAEDDKKKTNGNNPPKRNKSPLKKNESKTGSVSSKRNNASSPVREKRALSPTIIKPILRAGSASRSRSQSRKADTATKNASPSVPSVSATKSLNKRPLSANNCLAALVNYAMDRTSTVRFVQNVTRTMMKKTSSAASSSSSSGARNLSLNKTLSLPMNNHKTTDLYHPYLLAADQLCRIRDVVDRAISQKKTFTIVGNYFCVRRALEERGWIEKLRITYTTHDQENLRKLQSMTIPELLNKINDRQVGATHKRIIMSKLLARHQVDLYWDQNVDAFKHNPDKVKFTTINMIKRGAISYSSKLGLCESLKRSHWYQVPDVSCYSHPRSYSLTNNGDPDDFVRDFKLTAAISMLQWILYVRGNPQYKLISDYGKIPIGMFHFAMTECAKFLRRQQHQDIDVAIDDAPDLEWNQFLDHYYKAVHIGSHFHTNDMESEDSMAHKSKIILDKLRDVWPYLDMDGWMNIWILKPIHGSRGIGIYICRTLQYVLKVITENKNSRYVIQKYIERPLLIYNTKFDIRQWFLISSTTPITIWMYKDCYLRFSSQTYNLRKLHESIHLTNNSVQCRYKNCNRDPAVPSYNMWDAKQFRNYLCDIGQPDAYDTIIYPGMKQSLVAAVLMNVEYITPRRNCFELYGADFMLTEDFRPWLIEINSRPALHASTPVTARMCKEMLVDVIKVVVDNARLPTAPTGLFELIHKEANVQLPALVDVDQLKLIGRPLLRSDKRFFDGQVIDKSVLIDERSIHSLDLNSTKNYLSYVSKEMRDNLMKLLNIIQGEKERRHASRWNDDDKTSIRLHGTTASDDAQSDPIDRVGRDGDGGVTRDEVVKELFVKGETADTTMSTNTLSTSCSNYATSKSSIDKFLDVYKDKKRYVFKDVHALIDGRI